MPTVRIRGISAAFTILLISTASAAAPPEMVASPYSPPFKSAEEFWTKERMEEATQTKMFAEVQPRNRSLAAMDFPFTRFRVFPNTAYPKPPHGAIGKLFMTYPGGVLGVCTATAIGNYAVATAAHCLYSHELGAAATSATFVPRYNGGPSPKGIWASAYPLIPSQWVAAPNRAFDYAALIVHPNNGQTIEQAVGSLPILWNDSRQMHWLIAGYPAASPFTGERQFLCAAGSAVSDTTFSPPTMGLGCDMTQGASGGPWIVGYRGENYINGITSYALPGVAAAFSPYFDSVVKAAYDCAVASTPNDFACD